MVKRCILVTLLFFLSSVEAAAQTFQSSSTLFLLFMSRNAHLYYLHVLFSLTLFEEDETDASGSPQVVTP